MKITFLGCPRPVGGANVEAGHTALMFRRMGHDVVVISTSPEPPGNPWPARLRKAGCEVWIESKHYEKLKDELCISFCCEAAVRMWPTLHARGCRLIYSPCMCHTLPHEREVFSGFPPTAVHFQSEHQYKQLYEKYFAWGTERIVRIIGAFDLSEFPYQPRSINGEFVIAKLARSTKTKWPAGLFRMVAEMRRSARLNISIVCQGWSPDLEASLGKPPAWAHCFLDGTHPSTDILCRSHVMSCWGQYDTENWPRVGLEAMSTGVPVIADDRGGWKEMLGLDCGFLVGRDNQVMLAVKSLAASTVLHKKMAEAGRARIEGMYQPGVVESQWSNLLSHYR